MSTFTLDDIRAAADKKFGHMDVTLSDGRSVRLQNALRLPKHKRDELIRVQEQMDADGADQEALLAESLRIVATNRDDAEQLIREVGGDLAVMLQIFASYSERTEAGEA